MSDYSVKVSIRNNKLLSAIEGAGYESVAAFCRAAGVGYPQVNGLLSMRESAYRRVKGDDYSTITWRPVVIQIADFLSVSPHDLFTPRQAKGQFATSSMTLKIDETQLVSFNDECAQLSDNTLDNLDKKKSQEDLLAKLLAALPERERWIVVGRFGLTGDPKTLRQLGDANRVNPERVRQLEAVAFRRMKNQLRIAGIRQLADVA